jgi:hypothetical protein
MTGAIDMRYQNMPDQVWAAGLLSRVFNLTLDDVINQWTTSGVINVTGKGIDANHILTGDSYRETAALYSFLKYDADAGARGYPSLIINRPAVLSIEDINGINNRVYTVLLDKATSAVILPLWIEADVYTRQTSIYTKK